MITIKENLIQKIENHCKVSDKNLDELKEIYDFVDEVMQHHPEGFLTDMVVLSGLVYSKKKTLIRMLERSYNKSYELDVCVRHNK